MLLVPKHTPSLLKASRGALGLSHSIWRPKRYIQTETSRTGEILSERFRVLFMGRDEFSCLVLQELYKAQDVWKDIVITTQPDVHVGRRGSVLSISPLKILGEKLGLPVHTIPKVRREFRTWQLPPPFLLNEVQSSAPTNHLLVTASFGRILTGKMLNSFQPSRRLNVHPSLLPAYRGPAPIQHTILNNEKETGVCVIEMLKKSEGIDAGSLWACEKMPVPGNATFSSLRDDLATAGGKLLVSVLRDALSGKAVAQAQSSADKVPAAPLITAEDAAVNFNTMTASDIFRRFRAISHQKPLTTCSPDGKPLHLRELTVLDPSLPSAAALPQEPGSVTLTNKVLTIRCADSTVLGVSVVKPEGKSDRNAHEFWNGLRAVKQGEKFVEFGKCAPAPLSSS
ncbi:Formyltransferase [Agrocybe pediades]|nr:Formyltransferase [Agrocybe pediades]